MSLILDALKKADSERLSADDASSEGLDYTHLLDEKAKPKSWLLTLGIGIVLSLSLIGLVFFWLNDTPTATSSEHAHNTPAPDNPQAQTVGKPKNEAGIQLSEPKPETHAQTKPEHKPSSQNKQPAAQIQQAREDLRQALIAEQYASPQAEKVDDKAIAQLYQEAPTTTSSNAKTTTSASQANATTQASTTEDIQQPNRETLSSYGNIYFIKGLPFSQQKTIPTLMYSSHNYQNGNSSSVVLNGTRYTQGARLEEGLVLEKIVSDGIILRSSAGKFKMRALNSWLNY